MLFQLKTEAMQTQAGAFMSLAYISQNDLQLRSILYQAWTMG